MQLRGTILLAIGLTALHTAMCAARGEVHIGGIRTHARSNVSIDMIGYFETLPPAGYVPVRVIIDNRTQADRSWRFTFRSDSSYRLRQQSTYTWDVTVEANRRSEFELSIPLAPVDTGKHGYPSLQVTVNGYGIEHPNGYYASSHTYSGNPKSFFAGLSKELAVQSLGPLTEEATQQSLELRSCSLDPDWLSPDWRTYIGFSTIWFSERDWVQVRAAERAALLKWVSQGGVLVFVADDVSARVMRRAGLPGTGIEPAAHGLGVVRGFVRRGDNIASPEVVRHMQRWGAGAHADSVANAYKSGWNLVGKVDKADMNAPVIILAIVVFALLVGPINLLVLAGKTRRHRLFVTTPLLSLGASVVMLGLILLQDGLGGEGARVALVHLLPEENQELIIQEQLSRTGVLFSSAFAVPADVHVGTLLLMTDRGRTRRALRRDPAGCSGNWFSNRAVQGHYLSQIRSSRARVERVSGVGEPPTLLSSVDRDLADVFYIDGEGEYWTTDLLRVGERTRLRPAHRRDFDRAFWGPTVKTMGIRGGGQIDELAHRDGYVYGRVVDPGGRFLDTLPTVDWTYEMMIVAGPCVNALGGGE